MYIRFEEYDIRGNTQLRQLSVEEFCSHNLKDQGDYHDRRSDLQVVVDGTAAAFGRLISVLIAKNSLTAEDIENILPEKNYSKIISFDRERDINLW